MDILNSLLVYILHLMATCLQVQAAMASTVVYGSDIVFCHPLPFYSTTVNLTCRNCPPLPDPPPPPCFDSPSDPEECYMTTKGTTTLPSTTYTSTAEGSTSTGASTKVSTTSPHGSTLRTNHYSAPSPTTKTDKSSPGTTSTIDVTSAVQTASKVWSETSDLETDTTNTTFTVVPITGVHAVSPKGSDVTAIVVGILVTMVVIVILVVVMVVYKRRNKKGVFDLLLSWRKVFGSGTSRSEKERTTSSEYTNQTYATDDIEELM